ncbi:hypothetical protein AB0J75_34240, partial [Streptomyces sp. NPDC049744]
MTDEVKETFANVSGGRRAAGGGSASPAPPAPAALAAKVRTLAPSMTRSMQRVAEGRQCVARLPRGVGCFAAA